MATTPALLLSNPMFIHNKYNKTAHNIKTEEKLGTTYQQFYQNSNKSNQDLPKIKTLKNGINELDYYFIYSDLFLNHALLTKIQTDLGSVDAIIGVLLSMVPGIGTIAGVIATLLSAQWYLWNIPSYDQGNGVGINLLGTIPQIITTVWAQ